MNPSYVWLIDLGVSTEIRRARQVMKERLLALVPQGPSVSTSFSYTSHYMAMAVSFSGAVGVDIEDTRREFDFEGIAEFAFTEQERRSLQSPGDFYRIWTAKEALIKAAGLGGAMEGDFTFDTVEVPPIRLTLCRQTG